MNYRYCQDGNFEDLASGRVLIHRSGYPNFPVRLAQEIFCRCRSYLPDSRGPVTVYDPCCGGGYLLTVLGFLNGREIGSLIGSDISGEATALAGENLSRLTPEGMEQRREHLERLYREQGKPSVLESLASLSRLSSRMPETQGIQTRVFQADALSGNLAEFGVQADIVITDVPYGNLVAWDQQGENPADRLLRAVGPVLSPGGIAAICSDKGQKITPGSFRRLERQLVGKRKFEIFQAV